MRRVALTLAAIAAIISGCRDNSGVRGYWSSRTLNLDDYPAAEEEFTDFVELTASATEADACHAIDVLLKKARRDDVTYIVYADLILKGFSSISSPCRNCAVFLHAADNILSHGIPSGDITARYEKRRQLCLHNAVGEKAEIPEVYGDKVPAINGRTLILVIDQDCSTCRNNMHRFSSPKWEGTALVAICYGRGPLPELPGWDCYRISREQTLIDPHEGPFFYVISSDGTVEISYTSVYDENRI